MDDTTHLVPHMNVGALISLTPGMEILATLEINIMEEYFPFLIEMLGGLNVFFLCKNEGHLRKDCPILKRKNAAKPQPTPASPTSNSSLNVLLHTSPPKSSEDIVNTSQTNPQVETSYPQFTFVKPTKLPGEDIANQEGFQLVVSKKCRKKSNPSTSTSIARNQLSSVASPSHMNALIICPIIETSSCSPRSKPPGKLDILLTSNLPPKLFKEIDDDCTLEIIPADSADH